MSFARVGAADYRNRRNREEGGRAADRCRPQAGADNRLRLAALLMLTGTRRTVLMLTGCQALSMTGGSIVGLTGAIVGNMLTPDKALSTQARGNSPLLARIRAEERLLLTEF